MIFNAGLSSLGVPGVPWHTQIWADQLTLFETRGTDYAHLITTGTPGFLDLPRALKWPVKFHIFAWISLNSDYAPDKNQHTQRKLLNFESWINGGLRSFQKSVF